MTLVFGNDTVQVSIATDYMTKLILTSTRLCPINICIFVDVGIVGGRLANVLPWIQFGVVSHSTRGRAVRVGAVDKVIAI